MPIYKFKFYDDDDVNDDNDDAMHQHSLALKDSPMENENPCTLVINVDLANITHKM